MSWPNVLVLMLCLRGAVELPLAADPAIEPTASSDAKPESLPSDPVEFGPHVFHCPAEPELVDPKRVKGSDPVYPDWARRTKLGGKVAIEFIIDERGVVKDLHDAGSVRDLYGVVRDAIAEWEFEPATYRGAPTLVYARVTARFDPRAGSTRRTQTKDAPDSDRPVVSGGGVKVQQQVTLAIPPKLVTRVPPEYPKAAGRSRIAGRVVLSIVIDTEGIVRAENVVQSIPGLDQAAIDAVRRWRFLPATYAGVPIFSVIYTSVSFQLHEDGMELPTPFDG